MSDPQAKTAISPPQPPAASPDALQRAQSRARLCGAADPLCIHLSILYEGGPMDASSLAALRDAAKTLIQKIDAHGALMAGRPEPEVTTPAQNPIQTRIAEDLKRRF